MPQVSDPKDYYKRSVRESHPNKRSAWIRNAIAKKIKKKNSKNWILCRKTHKTDTEIIRWKLYAVCLSAYLLRIFSIIYCVDSFSILCLLTLYDHYCDLGSENGIGHKYCKYSAHLLFSQLDTATIEHTLSIRFTTIFSCYFITFTGISQTQLLRHNNHSSSFCSNEQCIANCYLKHSKKVDFNYVSWCD